MNKVEKNIQKIIWFRILLSFLLILPIITLFFLERGLTMTQIFITQGVYSAGVLIGEVPSGYLADKFGKKKSIILGSVLFGLGMSLYIIANTFTFFIVTEIIMGIGYSMISGADSAMLYDTLKVNGQEEKYHEIESKSHSYSMYSIATSGILGGVLGSFSLLFPFYGQIIIFICMLIVVISLYEVPEIIVDGKGNNNNDGEITIKKITSFFINTSDGYYLIKLFFFTGIFFTAIQLAFWYQQPFWKELSIPVIYFGLIFAGLMYLRGFVSNYSVNIERKLGTTNTYYLLVSLIISGFLGLAFFTKHIGVIIFFTFFEIAGGIASPLFKKYVNQHTKSNIRATVLSIESMFSRIIFVLLSPLFGYFLDIFTFQQVFYITGGFFTIALISSFLLLQKDKKFL